MSSGWRAIVALVTALVTASGLAFLQASQTQPAAASGQLTLRIIVVSSADEAARIAQRLAAGENFIALAAKVSLDASAESGGLLGRVSPSTLRPELRNALQGLGVGQTSPVVRIPTGFAILKVVADTEDAPVKDPGPALAATGSVKYAIDVSGMGEALVAMNQSAHPSDWDVDPRALCDMRRQSIAAVQAALERDATPASAADPVQSHYLLGQTFAYQGKMDRSIEEFQKAREIALVQAPSTILTLEETLGIAYLHRSGFENGVYQHPADLCLLSPAGTRALPKTADAEKAVEHFLRYLAQRPDDLEVKWLLNLAYMSTGGYPGKVPPADLIPPSALASAEDVGRFADVAPQAGLTSFASAGGLIVDDFDNDGRFDVVTSSVNSCEAMHFFHRNADGTFTDQSVQAGVSDQMGSLNILQADYNNDGFTDILMLRGGWEFPQRKTLLRNNGNGTFTDVTVASGLAKPATQTQAAVWTDINNDGFLDLFVGTEHSPAQLFLNKGDGTFVDIARPAGVNRTAFTKGVTAGDFDNDGWPDLFVSNIGGPNFLYHNNHDGTFTDVAKPAGVGAVSQGFATWFFDYDNDGWPDLFVTSYFTSVDETVRTYLGLPHNAATLKLYRNQGDWSFQDVTRQAGLDKVFMPMGANFGDIDNDGFLDIYLGTGNPIVRIAGAERAAAQSGRQVLHRRDDFVWHGRDAQRARRGVRRHGQRRRRGAAVRGRRGDAGRRARDAAVPQPGARQRLDHAEARGREVQPRRGRRAHQGHGGRRRPRHACDLPHRRQRRILRRVTAGAAHRPGQERAHRRRGGPVADHQHPAALRPPGEEPVARDHRRLADAGPARAPEAAARRGTDTMTAWLRLIRFAAVAIALLPSEAGAAAQKDGQYAMRGMVMKVAASRKSFIVSHDSVPDVMDAMMMSFDVREPKDLDGIEPGMTVTFSLVAKAGSVYAEQVRIRPYQSAEQDPLTARRLALLKKMTSASPVARAGGRPVRPGLHVDRPGAAAGHAVGVPRQGRGDQFHLHQLRPAAVLFPHRQ